MHQFYTFILTLFVFASNAQKHIVPEPFRSPGTLHPMPLTYTGLVPDVYLPGDSITKAHVRTHIVEIISYEPGNNYMLEKLKEKAKEEGLDGVAIQQFAIPFVAPDGLMAYSLTGIGLKYLDRISYLDTIVRQRVVTSFLPGGQQDKIALLEFDWHGNLLTSKRSVDFRFYADSMSMLDLNLIFNRISPIYTYNKIGGSPVLRIISAGNWPRRTIHEIVGNTLEIDHMLSSSSSTIRSEKPQRVKIKPVYAAKRLTGAVVTTRDRTEMPLYYLHYKHDGLGRLTHERWEKLIDGKRTLWLEVENRFFEADSAVIKNLAKSRP